MPTVDRELARFAFDTELGWMAVAGEGETVSRVVFGYRSQDAAMSALGGQSASQSRMRNWYPALVDRLCAYAAGEPDDFSDVLVSTDHLGPFELRVVRHCRRIPYGQSRTYGQLAAAAGSPNAARAVGNTMAHNRCPLLVPCHRVVASGGGLGGFSAPNGLRTKTRLLALEGCTLPARKLART